MPVEPTELEPGPGSPCEAVERDNCRGTTGERRGRDEPGGTEATVGPAVRREEDECVERGSRRLGRPCGGVGACQLHERRGATRVVVRTGAPTCVVSMGDKDDGLFERALDDGRQVPELDPPDTGDVGAPTVFLDSEAVERELVAEPVGCPAGAERARHPACVVAGELDRQRRRGGAVERRRKRRGGERAQTVRSSAPRAAAERRRPPRACARGVCSAGVRPSRASAFARPWSRRDHEVRGGLAASRGLV